MFKEKYDVVVVGSGPGGSTAARFAAEQGVSVLVLERHTAIGQPMRCGEMLDEKTASKYTRIDEKWVANRVSLVRGITPNEKSFQFELSNRTLILERILFDRQLAENAAKAGAEIYCNCDVNGLLFDNDTVNGVKFKFDHKEYEVKADVIIAADGIESRVANYAKLPVVLKKQDSAGIMGAVVYSPKIKEDDPADFYLSGKHAPGAYAWIFPKRGHRANVGLGINDYRNCKEKPRILLKKFLDEVLGEYTMLSTSAGGISSAKPLKQPWGKGILVVGDAGRFINPLTGGGISTAMLSGKAAGELAGEAVLKNIQIEKLGKKYKKILDKGFARDYERNYLLKKSVEKDMDNILNKCCDTILSIPEEKRSARNAAIKVAASQPKLFGNYVKAVFLGK